MEAGLDWGSVPDWFAGIGGIMSVGVAWYFTASERKQRTKLQEQTEQIEHYHRGQVIGRAVEVLIEAEFDLYDDWFDSGLGAKNADSLKAALGQLTRSRERIDYIAKRLPSDTVAFLTLERAAAIFNFHIADSMQGNELEKLIESKINQLIAMKEELGRLL